MGRLKQWALLELILLLMSVDVSYAGNPPLPGAIATSSPVDHLAVQVISKKPHDTTAFTEGLLWHTGLLYESAGLYGQSSVREVDPQTGKILRQINLPPQYFGEGLALADNRLIQLTWREQVAFVYDVNTFAQLGTLTYTGEGWGLCFDGRQFFQTDGSSTIVVRDAATFQVKQQLAIALDDQPVINLNELECVGDSLYANIWHTDHILRIEKDTGHVTAVIDASGLLTFQEMAQAGTEGVLNGIAYDSQHDTFLITGKLWPWVFEVRFVPTKSG